LDALHGEERNDEVRLYAFDLLSDDGVDMRNETLQVRKLWLGKLLKRPADGIIYNDLRPAPSVLDYLSKLAGWLGRDCFEASESEL